MQTEMATTKKTSPRGARKPSAKPVEPEGRKKSLFTRIGDEAKAKAQRDVLLKTLRANDWNLTHTAVALELPGPSQVIRAIRDLELEGEYEAAKSRGAVGRGRPAES